MTKHLLPFRMGLLHHLATTGKVLTGQDLLAALAVDYGSERQCTLRVIIDHLLNMISLGLVNMEGERFDDDHNLVISFSISEEGRACNKYYPAAWKF